MPTPLDLDRYFARIGYHGPRASTLDVLHALQHLHPHAIPFENLDALTGRRVSLELDAIVDKLVNRQRGGYCFEQNALFANVLMQLGFSVTPLLARVLWGRAPGTVTPKTHMLMRVDLDGEAWIADVGFGAATLTSPLRIVAGEPQQTTREQFRLADASHGAFDLELKTGDTWIEGVSLRSAARRVDRLRTGELVHVDASRIVFHDGSGREARHAGRPRDAVRRPADRAFEEQSCNRTPDYRRAGICRPVARPVRHRRGQYRRRPDFRARQRARAVCVKR